MLKSIYDTMWWFRGIIFCFSDSESDFRKQKDKQPPASISGGQMLPAIANDKPNRVSQVQGSLRDQIGMFTNT